MPESPDPSPRPRLVTQRHDPAMPDEPGNFLDSMKNVGPMVETPYLIRHVETHLVFGPQSRHFSVIYLVILAFILFHTTAFFSIGEPLAEYLASQLTIGGIWTMLTWLGPPLLLIRQTYRQQAIMGWILFKLLSGIFAFTIGIAGGILGLQEGRAEAWPMLFLALIWFPSVEFIPIITPHQRYVSLLRITLSIPWIHVLLSLKQTT